MDLLEHEHKQEQRNITIDKACKVAHANMDNVKAFHSKMMLSDVLHERELQVKHRNKKQHFEKTIDRMWEDTEMANLDAHNDNLKRKLVEEQQLIQQTSNFLKD